MSESHSIQCDEGNGDTTLTSWHPAFRPDEVSASAQDSHATTFSSPQEQYDHSVPSKDITDSLLSVHGTPELPETVVTQPNSQDDALVPLAEQQPAAVWDSSEEGGGFFDNLSGENTTQAAVSSDAQVAPIAEPGEAGVFRRDESKQTASSEDFGAHFITQEPSQAPQDPEADAVDPAWGLSRTNSDAFEVLGHIDRTSSFPQFALQPSHPLAPTQAEAILEAENERDEREEDLEHLAPDRQDDNGGQLDELLWTQHQEGRGSKDEDASFFDNFNEHQDSINEPSDAEARFEEGVPLVAEHNEEEEANGITGAGPSAMDALFHSDPEPSDVSFFNQPHQQEVSEQDLRHNLERKDTVDVLSSMRFDAHGSSNERETNQQDPISVKILNRDPNPPAQQEDIDAMWKAALEDDEFLPDDDDGFLSDGSDGPFPGDQNDQSLQNAPQSQPVQRPGVVSQRAPSSYTPHQPSTSEMAQGFSGSPWTGSAEPSPLGSSFNHQPQRPELMPKTESFVDQKGGYKSPYDLPEDLTTRHKRRVQMQPSVQSLRSSGAPPPPRSSSMASDAGFVQPLRQSSQSSPNIADFSRPGTSSSVGPPSTGALNGTRPPIQAASSSSSFFEELPVASRPRPTTSSGRYTPMQTSGLQAPPPMAGIRSVSSASGPLQPPIDVQTPKNASLSEPPKGNTYAQFELQKPERLGPYANISQQASTPPVPSNSRYSPAPPASQTVPRVPSASRYSPAPPPQPSNRPQPNRYASQANQPPQSTSTTLPFQPRTSSPLAYHEKPTAHPPSVTPAAGTVLSPPVSPPSKRAPSFNYTQQIDAQRRNTPLSTDAVLSSVIGKPALPTQASRAPSQYLPQSDSSQPNATTPRQRSSEGIHPPPSVPFVPRRSQTQSPSQLEPSPAFVNPVQPPVARPASASTYHPQSGLSRQRTASLSQNFISPSDGTEFDNLQRWRGSPIFHFTPGGFIVSNFPNRVPRYTPGQALPSVKPTAGETKVSSAKEILNVDTQAARFPGPLRSKSKKKEVLTWLSERISLLEQVNIAHSLEPQLPDPLTCRTEKVLLWKVLRIFVEHDGVVEGKVDAQKAIAALLVPESNFPETNGIHPDEGSHTNGIHSFHGYQLPSDPVDPSAVEQIRIFLLHGEREKAVWDAVDHRLWAHAMLIASTLDRTVWKQVVQEFVRQEVKTVGENTESLAALYQCFAGNLEDSIDQLVPPSARAGLQMVSKVASNGPTKNALDGLNKWRETLCLAVNNRCPDDHVAIAALGRLLMTYSRIEASHICFLLSHAMPAATFGGADEPQANIVLLGVDQRQPGFYNDEDAIILTEIYEFATSVLASHVSTSALLPHLQGYKFQRAVMLAETGFKTEALQYCEAISGAVKAVTKVSPYFHPLFIAELDEFYNRLRQAPVEASSSWKPSMEKVSGSLLSKFNTFVTGGDDETASTGSAKDAQEFGPFAKVAGTPNISREPSSVDLYSSFTNGGSQPMPVAAGGGRYNPNNQYAPRSSSEQVRGRSSLDVARSPSYSSTRPQKSPSLDQSSFAQATTAAPSLASPYQGLMQSPPQYQPSPPSSSYVPLSGATESPYTPQQRSYAPTPPISDPSYQHIPSQQSYAPNAPTNNLDHTIAQTPMNTEQVPAFGGYQPHIQQSPLVPSQPSPPPTEEHKEQPRESYQSYGGYEPPSYGTGYVPYEPEPDDEPDKKSDAPKKSNSFMDLDDNDPMSTASTMTAVKPVNKDLDRARKDAEADAAFRHAAEEDAKRSAQKTLNKKGSWFGTWFAKGEENKSEAGQKVYKAKLGEESAFYYDKELKKWVNKKDPNSATAVAKAAPPPPRTGPPSRMPSGMGPPPPPGPSSGPPKSVGLPPSTSMPSIPNPPSRAESPGTNGSTPSLAAPPPFQRAATGPSPAAGPPRPKLSSKPSDIDDLLGGPLVSRTGGTASRGAKKKRTGYVDIMAQQK